MSNPDVFTIRAHHLEHFARFELHEWTPIEIAAKCVADIQGYPVEDDGYTRDVLGDTAESAGQFQVNYERVFKRFAGLTPDAEFNEDKTELQRLLNISTALVLSGNDIFKRGLKLEGNGGQVTMSAGHLKIVLQHWWTEQFDLAA